MKVELYTGRLRGWVEAEARFPCSISELKAKWSGRISADVAFWDETAEVLQLLSGTECCNIERQQDSRGQLYIVGYDAKGDIFRIYQIAGPP